MLYQVETIQHTGLDALLVLLTDFGNVERCGSSIDCLRFVIFALCSLINLLLISFCSSRRSSSYHHVGRPYSQTRPSLAHSVQSGSAMSQLDFLNKQVQHPKLKSATMHVAEVLACLDCFWENRYCIQHHPLCSASG